MNSAAHIRVPVLVRAVLASKKRHSRKLVLTVWS